MSRMVKEVQQMVDVMRGQGDPLQHSCGNTYRKLRDELFPKDLFRRETTKMDLCEYRRSRGHSVDDEVLQLIEESLNDSGGCGVALDLNQTDHIFLLLKLEGKVWNAESYYLEYPPRITEMDRWKTLLGDFILAGREGDDVKAWNEMFHTSEEYGGSSMISIKTFRR
jgi:hypothetical protein